MKCDIIVLSYRECTSAKLPDEHLLICWPHSWLLRLYSLDSLLGVVISYHITSIIYCWISDRESYELDGCGCWFLLCEYESRIFKDWIFFCEMTSSGSILIDGTSAQGQANPGGLSSNMNISVSGSSTLTVMQAGSGMLGNFDHLYAVQSTRTPIPSCPRWHGRGRNCSLGY